MTNGAGNVVKKIQLHQKDKPSGIIWVMFDHACSVFTDLTYYEDYSITATAFPESNTCNFNLHIVTRMLAIYKTGGWGG